MSFLKRLFGPNDPPPVWAAFFKPAEWAEFASLVETDLSGRNVDFRLDSDEGVAYVDEGTSEEQHLGLGNLSQLIHISPRRDWKNVVRNHFDQLFRSKAEMNEASDKLSDFESIGETLKVRIYPADMPNREVMAFREIANGIIAALVIDLPETVMSVPRERPEEWGLPLDSLFERGLANVRNQDEVRVSEMPAHDGATVTLLTGDSFFTATHALLLEDHLPKPPPELGALVAVPNRHAVIFHSIVDHRTFGALSSILQAAHGMCEQGPGSISPNVYWWHDGKLTHLPAPITDNTIDFDPPEEFIYQVMNRIRPKGD